MSNSKSSKLMLEEIDSLKNKLNNAIEQLESEKKTRVGLQEELIKGLKLENEGEKGYGCLFENINDGCAYHQIITDENGKP
ncbi:MAG: hypothetical protein ACXAD7_23410, partial [Candidatus Kariarchaeaceae archaeon]